MNMSIERVVTLFTPLFAAIAGWVTAVIGKLVPGLNLSSSDLTALFIAGTTVAVAAALKWLHGRQKFVQVTDDADRIVEKVVGAVKSNQTAALALSDIEAVVKAHADDIVEAVGKAVGATPKAEELAEALLQNVLGQHSQEPASVAAQPAVPPTAV